MISPGMGEMTNVSLANGTVVDSTGAIMVASPLTCHQQVSPDQAQMGEYGAPPVHNSHSPQLSNGSKATVNGHQQANGSNGNQSASHQPGNIHSTAEYLQQLLKDRARLGAFPGTFIHAERLLDAGKFTHVLSLSPFLEHLIPQKGEAKRTVQIARMITLKGHVIICGNE